MSFNKPFHRNYRPVKESYNSGYSDWAYIIDKDYAQQPEQYTRAFLIIQNDIMKLFEFVEPADDNNKTFSYRIHELFIRVCIEIEANFKAILKENIFNPINKSGKTRPEKEWNINDYKLINKTHHLDDYSIEFPIWKGQKNKRAPFSEWKSGGKLSWYDFYNKSKHDRKNNFENANFSNLMDAYSALCILLSSQFRLCDFQPGSKYIPEYGYCYYGGGFGIGDYLIVYFPDDWEEDDCYEFDWEKLQNESSKFQKINYNEIMNL